MGTLSGSRLTELLDFAHEIFPGREVFLSAVSAGLGIVEIDLTRVKLGDYELGFLFGLGLHAGATALQQPYISTSEVATKIEKLLSESGTPAR